MILHDPNTAAWMSHPGRNCNPNTNRPADIRNHAEDWFPTSGKWDTKRLCHGCPVQLACLTYALDNPELEGVWAGTTEDERRNLRRGMGATA